MLISIYNGGERISREGAENFPFRFDFPGGIVKIGRTLVAVKFPSVLSELETTPPDLPPLPAGGFVKG